MFVEFASLEEAVELTEIFYPSAVAEVRRRGARRVPYELLGVNPPRDLAFKVMRAMKIALIAPLVAAIREPQRGGSQAFVSDLARGLVGRGHEVTSTPPPDRTCPAFRWSIPASITGR